MLFKHYFNPKNLVKKDHKINNFTALNTKIIYSNIPYFPVSFLYLSFIKKALNINIYISYIYELPFFYSPFHICSPINFIIKNKNLMGLKVSFIF